MIKERPLLESDRELLARAIAADPYHADTDSADFYYQPNTRCLVYEDELGPIFFLRLSSVLWMHTTFVGENKERIGRAIVTQFPGLIQQAKQAKYAQIAYKSLSKSLVDFCRKYLGFSHCDAEAMWIE